MLQYILTAIAGIAIGVIGLRLWQMRDVAGDAPAEQPSAAGNSEANEPSPASMSLQQRMLLAAGIVALVAVAVFAFRPGADNGAGPGDGSTMASVGGATQLDDVNTMIERLAARLEDNPDDGEGFRMLGWSYVMTGRPDLAIAPYKRALELLPDNAVVHSGYGEALVGQADNRVTSEAKAQFDRALALDPAEPRARYFMALWKSQNGAEQEALEEWIALANDGPADAPWQAELRTAISGLSTKLGVDTSSRLAAVAVEPVGADIPVLDQATIQAANRLPDGERQAMIIGMVNGLAEKLDANPKDAEGWARLIRSRMVLGQQAQARADLATARRALAGDPTGLASVNKVASEFSLPDA